MRSGTGLWIACALLLTLTGCRVVAAALMIPIAVVAVVFGGLAGIFVSSDGAGDTAELHAGGIRIERRVLEVEIAEDRTFAGSLVVVSSVTGSAGIEAAQQASLSFDPRSQELELVSARVVNPDGSVHEVRPEQVFVRPSALARGAPGFVSSLTKSVLFPQIVVGSQTHAEWRFRETIPSALGFNYAWRPSFALPVGESRIRIAYPAGVPLRCAADAPFELVERVEGGRNVIEATLRDYQGQTPERAMVAAGDVCPRFVVTSEPSWEAIGAEFHLAMGGGAQVTPEVEALAARIVGEREGLDAARAIHRWVCANIQYVVVYLHPMDGWVPHPVADVLANGYGDCKDKVALLCALLAARGIEAEPVLVNHDRAFEPYALPTALQFNHCMAYLPGLDVYSNPTDAYRDLGDLASDLSGKFVVIGSARPRVARTPEGSADRNRYRVVQHVELAADGTLRGRSVMDFEGRTSGGFRRVLARSAAASAAADELLSAEPLGGHGALQTTDPTDLDLPLHCEGEWTSDVPIAMGPSIHFMTPVGIDLVNPALVQSFLSSGERRYPVLIGATEIAWRTELRLPTGYALDALPAERRLVTDAGRFESRYEAADGGRLVVERLLRIERDRFAPEGYAALRAILLEACADQQTILGATLDEPARR